ncbi:MAG TPA: acetolactate synthase [Ruminococcaceae bacterium]|nr:acetolactate synthase [Oscillospiraceae bacterium]
MGIYQVSVFVENKPGRLAEITGILSSAQINIRALSLADTTNFGILRLIVDNPQKAEKILTENRVTVNLTNVIGIAIPDEPGGLSKALNVLDENGMSVEYMYAFISRKANKACVIIRVENEEKAIKVLNENGIETLAEEAFDE